MSHSSDVDLFIEKYKKVIRSRIYGFVFLILWLVIFWLIVTLVDRFQILLPEVFGLAIMVAFTGGFFGVFYYLSKIRASIRSGDKFTYDLCKVYKEMGKIKGRGKLTKEKITEVAQKLVKGPINHLRSDISESDRESPSIFSSKNLSLLEKVEKSLMYQIYPIIKKGKNKDIRKAQRYLLPIIKTRIENDFDGYEAALANLEKELPTKKIELPEMITHMDKMKNWLTITYGTLRRSLFLRFLTFFGGIGLFFITVSFFIEISAETALVTTIIAASTLSAASRSR